MSKLRVLDMTYDGHNVYFDAKGYACIWLGGKNRKVHVLEWEKHNGEKPTGHEIHHKDQNKGNWSISNLELLTNSDHQRIHAGWIRDGGEWVAKPCTACCQVLPFDLFYPRKGFTPSARCKPCHVAATRQWALANPEKRRAIALSYYHRRHQANG